MATPVIPTLTAEQRQAAHRASLELRQKRAIIKTRLSSDWWKGSPADKFAWCWDEDHYPEAQGMKVIDLLTALPGIGMRRALALLQQAGIPSHNTVRACGVRQTEKLFGLLER